MPLDICDIFFQSIKLLIFKAFATQLLQVDLAVHFPTSAACAQAVRAQKLLI